MSQLDSGPTPQGNRPPISAKTQLCAVIGNPIGHSLSPALHNAAFEACGLDFVYTAFRVEDVGAALTGMRAMENFRGLSVTIPHKLEIMNHVDEIPEIDRRIGSINTVLHEGGKLIGLGTDGPGALKALNDAGANLKGKHVLMLGAGGASRAIAFTLVDQGGIAGLTLLDLDEALMKPLASELASASAAPITAKVLNEESVVEQMALADVVINCTPVGMHPKVEASLVPEHSIRADHVVFDVVYNPLKTKLLLDAEAKGCTIICGVEMFVNQAVLQFEKFTGEAAPYDVMRKKVLECLGV